MRLAVALLWGLIVAVGLYGPTRAVQYVLFPEANPATVIWSPHAGYFWRMLLVGYAGGMAAFVAYLLTRGGVTRAAHLAARALPVAAALLAAQSLLIP